MTQTTISAAFDKAGLPRWKIDIDRGIALALNNGVSAGEIRAHVEQRLSGMGQTSCAENGQIAYAQPRQPNGEAAGQISGADEGLRSPAPVSPTPSSAEGHCLPAEKATDRVPPGAAPDRGGAGHGRAAEQAKFVVPSPVREPSKTQIAAAARVAKKLSVFDTFKITERQGSKTAWGDIPVASYGRLLRTLRKRAWVSSREFNLVYLSQIEADRHAHIPDGAKTRDIIGLAQAEKMLAMATDMAIPAPNWNGGEASA